MIIQIGVETDTMIGDHIKAVIMMIIRTNSIQMIMMIMMMKVMMIHPMMTIIQMKVTMTITRIGIERCQSYQRT